MKLASRELSRAWQSFSIKQRLVLYTCLIISVLAIGTFWWQINNRYLIEIPTRGGSLTEGIVGAPRFANPLLAITDADRDIVSLVYSGLTRASTSGTMEPDLAESFAVSEDHLVYTFKLKPNLKWHDGKPLTADDIVFTISRAQDPILKSPRRAAWEGVHVSKIDELTVQFVLKQPYNGFLENTALGILPEHLWKDISIENFTYDNLNLEPIGSGPYQVAKVSKNKDNTINYFDLEPFTGFALGRPFLADLRLRFYENDEALIAAYKNTNITSVNAVAPEIAKNLASNKNRIITAPLPRVFGIFFNSNQNKIFIYSEVRTALNESLNKQEIINKVLFGFGTPLSGPLAPGATGYDNTLATTTDFAKATSLLEAKGWVKGADGIYQKTTGPAGKKETLRLAFTLVTSDAPELKAVAEQAVLVWKKLGADVTIKVFEKGDLSQDIIRPRKYDAVLFGVVVGRNPDPYVFWHSSQRFDPGLNIANYANVAVDKILEDLRVKTDPTKRLALYQKVSNLIATDQPAIFLYSPSFIYITPSKLKNVQLLPITIPADRFTNVGQWYIATDKVWPIFNR